MSHPDLDEFDGWEIYPQNLHLSPLDIDDARIAGRISRLAKGLFVDSNASTFSYLELGAPNQGILSYSDAYKVAEVGVDGFRDAQFVGIETIEKLSAAFKRPQDSSLL
jgi:hypothetical protein